MRSLLEKKPLVLLLAVLALGALTVLSASLRNVSFEAAQPIGREEAGELPPPAPLVLGEPGDDTVQSQIILIIAFVLLVALVSVLMSPEGRKRMFLFLFRMAFTILALYFVFNRYPDMLSFLSAGFTGEAPRPATLESGASVPPPVFTPPQETPLLNYAVSLLIVLGVGFLAWRAYLAWQVMNQGPAKSLQDLARIARSSLRDLSDGRETTDVIMNCYIRMSDVVADRRNLRRGMSMTPAEFALRMEEAGLPGDAVRRLTRLFENVRYGTHKAGPKDVNEAVACLTTILQYCGEPV